MKKFVICMFALFAFAATGANAQTDNDASKTRKEMLAERKEIRKASKAELDTKAVKQARKRVRKQNASRKKDGRHRPEPLLSKNNSTSRISCRWSTTKTCIPSTSWLRL